MNSRDRVLAAINHQPVDRVPLDIWAVSEVWDSLRARFGRDADFRALLHLDGFAGVGAKYVGPTVESTADEKVDFWGIRRRPSEYQGGVYWEISRHPLADARTIDDLERYRWPQADWFDYAQMRDAAAAAHGERAVKCGYMAPFTYHLYLRGLEAALVDPHDDADFTRHLLGRLCDFSYEHHRRMFIACEGLIDVAEVTDDYGTQTGPIMGLPTFRDFYRPQLQRFIDLAREFNIKVFHHDDGAIRAFLPDLVEMGIDVLNPVQATCPGMDMAALKRDFGARLCFHGGMDNQHVLPFGTPTEVRAEVRRCIDALGGDGTGYILAPCHNLQAVTPVDNIVAMYDEAWRYGRDGHKA